jgi:hypothetical protein
MPPEISSEQKTIVLLPVVMTSKRTRGTLYYFAGNFFWPMDLHRSAVGMVNGAIRRFIKHNRDMIVADRAQPDYLTIEQLCDLEPYDDKPEVLR